MYSFDDAKPLGDVNCANSNKQQPLSQSPPVSLSMPCLEIRNQGMSCMNLPIHVMQVKHFLTDLTVCTLLLTDNELQRFHVKYGAATTSPVSEHSSDRLYYRTLDQPYTKIKKCHVQR